MRRLLSLIAILGAAFQGLAQPAMDGELTRLVGAVIALRSATSASYEQIAGVFAADSLWTPMNETGPFLDQECRPSENVPGFKLNRLLTRVAMERKHVYTHGDMLNGEDSRYDYSLYERSVHRGRTVSYTLKGRVGRQWFVIVPISEKNSGLSATVSVGEDPPTAFSPGEKGILTIWLDTPGLQGDDPVRISVTGGDRDQGFVILNHNTRQ